MDEELLVVGARFRGYIVLRRIGCGGSGEVYLARHEVLGTDYAVKVVSRKLIEGNEETKTRFFREVRISARIRHPSLVAIHDAGFDETTGLYFIVMDNLPGGTVADALARARRFSIERTLRIGRTVAQGLAELARHQIVHRDVKPGNMLIAEDGSVKLADMGIARLKASGVKTVTETGFSLGTPAYMPYEQIVDSHAVDARADIYALGVSLYEMLTGVLPDGELSPSRLLKKRVDGERIPDIRTINSAIPDWLAETLIRMTEPDVEKRLRSLDDLVTLFTVHLPEQRTPRRSFASGVVRKRGVSVVAIAFLGALLGALVVAFGGFELLKARQPERQVDEEIEDDVRSFQHCEPRETERIVVREITNEIVHVVTVTNVVQKERTVAPMPVPVETARVERVSTPSVACGCLTNVVEGVEVFGPSSCRKEIAAFGRLLTDAADVVRRAHGLPKNQIVQHRVKTVEIVPGDGKYTFDPKTGRVRVGANYGKFPHIYNKMGQMCTGFMASYSEGFDDSHNAMVNSYVRLLVLKELTGEYGKRRLEKAVSQSPEMMALHLTRLSSGDVLARYFRIRREAYDAKKLFFSMSAHDFAAVLSLAYGESLFPFLRKHGVKVDEFASNVRIRGLKKAGFFSE